MATIAVDWCDFVVYSNGCVIVDQMLANLDYWSNLMEKLEHFYVTHVIPEILSGRIFMEEFGRYKLLCSHIYCIHVCSML